MKKLILLLAIVSGAFYSASAQYYSNNSNTNGTKIGIGLSSGFAVGTTSNYFPEAGGVSVNLEFPINKSAVSLLLSTGYTFYVSQGGYSVGYYGGFGASTYFSGDVASFIPVEAGLKVYVSPKVFIEGYVGASFNVNTYPEDYTGQTTAFVYSPAIGYTLPVGYNGKSHLDISLAYENRTEPGGGYSQIAARALWNFNL